MPYAETPSYLQGCPQLPDWLLRLIDGRNQRPLNVLQQLVLALHLRDCSVACRQERENFERETGVSIEVDPPQF